MSCIIQYSLEFIKYSLQFIKFSLEFIKFITLLERNTNFELNCTEENFKWLHKKLRLIIKLYFVILKYCFIKCYKCHNGNTILLSCHVMYVSQNGECFRFPPKSTVCPSQLETQSTYKFSFWLRMF